MSDLAHVDSIQAIRDFRAALAKFSDRAGQALDQADLDMRRVLQWLQHDQMSHWRNQVRRGHEMVAKARAELERRQMIRVADFRPSCIDEKKALQRAKLLVEEAERKIEIVRHWSRVVQQETSEYEGRIGQMRAQLDAEVPRALALLGRIVDSLESYAAGDPAFPSTALPGDASEESAARDSAPSADASLAIHCQRLRSHTPSIEQRREVTGAWTIPDDIPDEWPSVAAQYAESLGLSASYPSPQAKVVVDPAAWEAAEVYLQRVAGSGDDSGWYLGPNTEQPPEKLEATSVYAVLVALPHAVPLIALPTGTLALLDRSVAFAILDTEGKVLWREGEEAAGPTSEQAAPAQVADQSRSS